ncbi:MAG: periplasmic heavy metal sensor [Gemmobacter sp.]
MTEPVAPGPQKHGGGGWRIAFAVLLALNLLVAGVAAGFVLRGGWRHDDAALRPVRDPSLGSWQSVLTDEDRRALGKALRAERDLLIGYRRAERAERAALAVALRADPFDPAAVDASLDRIAALGRERAEFGQRIIRAHLLALSPAERAALADRIEQSMQRRFGRDLRNMGPQGDRDRPRR